MPAKFYHSRTQIKRILWQLQRYEPSVVKPHVALFASRRGGSSWIMQVISANPEFRYIAQPFVAYDYDGHWGHHIVRYDYSRFLDPSPSELAQIDQFIDDIVSGRIVFRAPWRAWQIDYWRLKSRTIMKILQAKALMPWFANRSNLSIFYLLRHPLAQASSVIKSGWAPMDSVFLDHPTFCDKNLTLDQQRFCRKVGNQGSLFERHVLAWCLDNIVPLREIRKQHSWTVITYEDCVLRPELIFNRLSTALGVDTANYMRKQMPKASGTTKLSNRGKTPIFDERHLAKWLAHVSPNDIAKAFEILGNLDIDAYQPDSLLPIEKLRIS